MVERLDCERWPVGVGGTKGGGNNREIVMMVVRDCRVDNGARWGDMTRRMGE